MKKSIIISAVNLFEGGALSVLKDCLQFLNDSPISAQYRVIAFVHRKHLFAEMGFQNIKFVEFPQARSSYLKRLYLEYFKFKHIAHQYNVSFWLSMHDTSPRLSKNIYQAVYCHNASPFRTPAMKDLLHEPSLFFFSLFYKYLYWINIHSNRY